MTRWIWMLPLAVLVLGSPQPTQLKPAPPDAWLKRPVDDRTFKGYLDFFKYDTRLPFELRVR